jgi:hypothetical membrane protein
MRSAWITVAGVAAGVVFTAGWIAAGVGSSTADSVNGTLSDLGSSGADRPWIWNAARTISGVLVIAVAVGVFRKLPRRRDAAVAAAPARAARRGRRRRPCGHYRPYSWRNIGHELVSPFGSLGLVVALALFARSFGAIPRLRVLRRATVVTLALFVVTLVAFVAREDRPGLGIVQRISATVLFAWLAVLAVTLDGVDRDRLRSSEPPRPRVRRRRRRPGPPAPRP